MGETRKKISARQRFVGDKLKKSVNEYPQPFSVGRVQMDALMEYKKELKANGVDVTMGAFFAKAIGFVLQQYPKLNSRQEGMEAIYYDDVNVGMAMSVDDNLMVVVIKEIQNKKIDAVSDEIKGFRDKMVNRTITQEDVMGGTVTLSSLGKGLTRIACPILNDDECLMIGIGSIFTEPYFDAEGNLKKGSFIDVTVASNHYLANGTDINHVIDYFGEVIQNPRQYFG